MVKYLTPQEVEVLYILPALRRELTTQLKEKGLEQKEIAKLLKVTEPAISNYVNLKRASEVKFSDKVKEEIKKAAESIIISGDIRKETHNLLKLALHERITCSMCHKLSDTKPGCMVCLE